MCVAAAGQGRILHREGGIAADARPCQPGACSAATASVEQSVVQEMQTPKASHEAVKPYAVPGVLRMGLMAMLLLPGVLSRHVNCC